MYFKNGHERERESVWGESDDAISTVKKDAGNNTTTEN